MKKICKIDGCEKQSFGRGMCSMHYYRVLRNGHLSARAKAEDGAGIGWIKRHVNNKGDDCLIWPFGAPSCGYGQVRVNGADIVASRYMCALAHGNPPTPRHEAAHSCGNGHLGCMNPKHLRWATRSQNNLDRKIHETVRGTDAVRAVGS